MRHAPGARPLSLTQFTHTGDKHMQTLTVAWAWMLAHRVPLVCSASMILLALRGVPAERWAALERDWPRIANLARGGRAILPDLFKLAKVLVAIWTGRPWDAMTPPASPAPPSDPPSTVVLVRKPGDSAPPAAMVVLGLLVLGAAALGVSACSATEVRRQAVGAVTIATSGNTFLDVAFGPEKSERMDSLYLRAQQRVALAACGYDPDDIDDLHVDAGALKCADPDAMRAAVRVVRSQWAATMRVWTLARVAFAAWKAQLDRCQREQGVDAGATAACGPDLAQLQATVILNLTAVRCSLRGLGAPDPFPGTAVCAGETDGGQ